MNLEIKRNKLKKIDRLLRYSKLSCDNYNSVDKPFFSSDNEVKDFEMSYNDIGDIPSDINNNIMLMYKLIGNSCVEVYINDWTIISINEARKQYKKYCENNQFDIWNIGYRYMGLGHVEVLCCNLYNHLLFKRHDGGSNGYERVDNYNNILKFNSNDNNYEHFKFTKWYNENICKFINNDNR